LKLVDTQVEEWRYEAIKNEPCLNSRPHDWFLDGDHIVANIFGSWTFGVAMDFDKSKRDPKVFAICTSPERHLCNLKKCSSGCLERFWANASQGGVLGKKDLLRILVDPDPLDPVDPRFLIVDYQQAEQLFRQIEELEARQK